MSDRQRLDQALVKRGLVTTRSQAENWIRLGKVTVDGQVVVKPGQSVSQAAQIVLTASEQYVSRAGLKLASVATIFELDFAGKTVLDVGSSTGGFTDFALQHRTKRVFAIDVGTDQLHTKLRRDPRVELHEKTDIRHVRVGAGAIGQVARGDVVALDGFPDIIVIDVSFISLRDILPHIAEHLVTAQTQIVAMVKPQFEAGRGQVNKGIIKNNTVRRQVLLDFETWAKQLFTIQNKRDSDVTGQKGNLERFYLLKLTTKR